MCAYFKYVFTNFVKCVRIILVVTPRYTHIIVTLIPEVITLSYHNLL